MMSKCKVKPLKEGTNPRYLILFLNTQKRSLTENQFFYIISDVLSERTPEKLLQKSIFKQSILFTYFIPFAS